MISCADPLTRRPTGLSRDPNANDFGKSEWLLSFNQQHLDRCSHYRIMFYDEFLDVGATHLHKRRCRPPVVMG
jgi:hypothetical protein